MEAIGNFSIIIKKNENFKCRIPLFIIGNNLEGVANHLPKYQAVYLLPSAKIERTDQARFIESVAKVYCSEIQKVNPDGPYMLLGYCFAGKIAYAVAQNLKNNGKEVRFLFLIECNWLQSYTKRLHDFISGYTNFELPPI